jgi:hypothetical protein
MKAALGFNCVSKSIQMPCTKAKDSKSSILTAMELLKLKSHETTLCGGARMCGTTENISNICCDKFYL